MGRCSDADDGRRTGAGVAAVPTGVLESENSYVEFRQRVEMGYMQMLETHRGQDTNNNFPVFKIIS